VKALIAVLLWVAVCALLYSDGATATDSFTRAMHLARSELLLLIGTVVAAGLLRVLAPAVFADNAKILLLTICGLFTVMPADILLYCCRHLTGWMTSVEFLIPFTLAPLLAGVLLGAAAATVVGLWASYVCTVLFDNSIAVLVTGLIATAVVSSLVPRVRRRTQIIRIGLIAGLMETAGVVALLSNQPTDTSWDVRQIVACLIDGIGSALVVVTVLPLFETLFNLTTNVALLELSDLGQPLLQRLAFEAPGTYHHSLMVANLAQSAADEIGANPILARVGAYFHDIGKLTKPGIFVENIQGTENPHDNLAPSMSALLVMAHVKEGLSLAVLNKLPQAVIDVIQQHHGTGLAAYFHHKAGRQASSGPQNGLKAGTKAIDETPYRYPGPRPRGREATIIMLADAVEAASRSLEKPTPAHIGELVDRLIDGRLEDGQLDDSEMTLHELARVKHAFLFCLTNMLHSRIVYPRS
jgi:putative nucleotidyltransferase with HDIG domain